MIKNDSHSNPFHTDANANDLARELIGRRDLDKMIENFNYQLEDFIIENIEGKYQDLHEECDDCEADNGEFTSMIMERIIGDAFMPGYNFPQPLPENTVRLSDIITQVNTHFYNDEGRE